MEICFSLNGNTFVQVRHFFPSLDGLSLGSSLLKKTIFLSVTSKLYLQFCRLDAFLTVCYFYALRGDYKAEGIGRREEARDMVTEASTRSECGHSKFMHIFLM